jgi:hypothetical protein
MTKRDLAAAAGVSTTARNAERGAPVGSKTALALDVDPPQRLGRPSHLA